MKFFVTGRSSNYQRVVAAFDEIERLSHEVTLRWTDLPMIKPYKENQQKAAEYATQQVRGVIAADVYILFAHKDGTGVFSEFGAALAMAELGKLQVFALGDQEVRASSMFHYHPLINWRESLADILLEVG